LLKKTIKNPTRGTSRESKEDVERVEGGIKLYYVK
tara:strand:- start:204 stop:308 length:105 start_codon:yes stop_codon:yes gene_type:complete